MTPEIPRQFPEITTEMMRELVEPTDWQQYGINDPLSDFLYGPMVQTGTCEPMLALIKTTETFLYKDFIDDETNQDMILRLSALLTDIPDVIHTSQRLQAWRTFFEADWVQVYSGVKVDIPGMILAQKRVDPLFGYLLTEELDQVLKAKREEFRETVGFSSVVPDVALEPEFKLDSWACGIAALRQVNPDGFFKYGALSCLALACTQLKH